MVIADRPAHARCAPRRANASCGSPDRRTLYDPPTLLEAELLIAVGVPALGRAAERWPIRARGARPGNHRERRCPSSRMSRLTSQRSLAMIFACWSQTSGFRLHRSACDELLVALRQIFGPARSALRAGAWLCAGAAGSGAGAALICWRRCGDDVRDPCLSGCPPRLASRSAICSAKSPDDLFVIVAGCTERSRRWRPFWKRYSASRDPALRRREDLSPHCSAASSPRFD